MKHVVRIASYRAATWHDICTGKHTPLVLVVQTQLLSNMFTASVANTRHFNSSGWLVGDFIILWLNVTLNTSGHIGTVHACSSGTCPVSATTLTYYAADTGHDTLTSSRYTYVAFHSRHGIETQDMTPHPITIYIHRA